MLNIAPDTFQGHGHRLTWFLKTLCTVEHLCLITISLMNSSLREHCWLFDNLEMLRISKLLVQDEIITTGRILLFY